MLIALAPIDPKLERTNQTARLILQVCYAKFAYVKSVCTAFHLFLLIA